MKFGNSDRLCFAVTLFISINYSYTFYRGIAKKLKEYEYKIQRHTKTKEDYLRYIQYEMDLLKLIKQRRDVCFYTIIYNYLFITYGITPIA